MTVLTACLTRDQAKNSPTGVVPQSGEQYASYGTTSFRTMYCDSISVTGRSGAACFGVNSVCVCSPTNGPSSQPVNNTQYSPSITHSMCLDGKHVAGPSGAARPGVNSVGVPGNRPQKSAHAI